MHSWQGGGSDFDNNDDGTNDHKDDNNNNSDSKDARTQQPTCGWMHSWQRGGVILTAMTTATMTTKLNGWWRC